MNFPIFLNKLIISNKYLRNTSFFWWYRLMNHDDCRLDDRHLYADFWYHLNYGWWCMTYDAFIMSPEADEAVMGIKPIEDIPDKIILSEEDYDALIEVLENPPPPTPFLRQLLSRSAPWDK